MKHFLLEPNDFLYEVMGVAGDEEYVIYYLKFADNRGNVELSQAWYVYQRVGRDFGGCPHSTLGLF